MHWCQVSPRWSSDIKPRDDRQQAFGVLIGEPCDGLQAGNLVCCMQICECRFTDSETQFLARRIASTRITEFVIRRLMVDCNRHLKRVWPILASVKDKAPSSCWTDTGRDVREDACQERSMASRRWLQSQSRPLHPRRPDQCRWRWHRVKLTGRRVAPLPCLPPMRLGPKWPPARRCLC